MRVHRLGGEAWREAGGAACVTVIRERPRRRKLHGLPAEGSDM